MSARRHDVTSYERRLLLATETLLRWKRLSVYWPPDATCAAEADPRWQRDLLRTFVTRSIVPRRLRPTREAA
jgi:hypothetical protein